MAEFMLLAFLLVMFAVLMLGFPVAFVLSGVSLIFALLGHALDIFPISYLSALPGRIFGIMTNDLLIAVPLFIFMGVTLEKSRLAESLLEDMSALFGGMRGGLGLSVIAVGTLLAASTGIVGATVVTMGLLSLPCMLQARYDPKLATGVICASGTLGQIIPPSIVLILLGDQMGSVWQSVQMQAGITSPQPVTVADLFMAAILPGALLVAGYTIWLLLQAAFRPEAVPATQFGAGRSKLQCLKSLAPTLLLIVLVLGSILGGIATASESAGVGAVGALAIAYARRQLSLPRLREVMRSTMAISCMIFSLLIGATFFTLVFRGYGGEDAVHHLLSGLPGGLALAVLAVMVFVFLLGFFLDFVEIIFIVVPIAAPILLMMGADPVWLAILFAVNLQTSFLTPPFGFALFYLRGVAPDTVTTGDIYRGIIPFVGIQLAVLALIALQPGIVTSLPKAVYGTDLEAISAKIGTASEAGPAIAQPPEDAPTWEMDF